MSETLPAASVIIPTYKEAPNLEVLLPRLLAAADAKGMEIEVIVSDDNSPDGTADVADRILAGRGRALRRTGPRGLAPAVIEGFSVAKHDVLFCMDADLSHPPELVPLMAAEIGRGADLAVGSRYVKGGGVRDWPIKRRIISRVACLMAWPVTRVKDATSGFFAIRRSALEGVELRAEGYKIGLEVFVKGKIAKFVEVPFVFTDRAAGESKLGGKVIFQYLVHLKALVRYRLGI